MRSSILILSILLTPQLNLTAQAPQLPPAVSAGLEAYKQFLSMYITAFPDLQFTVEDMIAEGDRVVARCTTRGSHQGTLMGIPPSGKRVTITGISITRIANGKAVEDWVNFDTLGMLQQIGAIPMPGQAS